MARSERHRAAFAFLLILVRSAFAGGPVSAFIGRDPDRIHRRADMACASLRPTRQAGVIFQRRADLI